MSDYSAIEFSPKNYWRNCYGLQSGVLLFIGCVVLSQSFQVGAMYEEPIELKDCNS